MSGREKIQEDLYRVICDLGFNAPYGVICGQETYGAKARTITFGRPRTLDATLRIFGPGFIQIKTSRNGTAAFTGPAAVAEAILYLSSI